MFKAKAKKFGQIQVEIKLQVSSHNLGNQGKTKMNEKHSGCPLQRGQVKFIYILWIVPLILNRKYFIVKVATRMQSDRSDPNTLVSCMYS